MSLRELLQRRQAHAVPPVPRSSDPRGTENPLVNQGCSPCSPSSLANATGTVEQPANVAANDPEPPGPASGIDLLLAHLGFDFTGAPLHRIDDELAGMIRLAMLPMGQRARAELAALIDDHLCRCDGRGRVLALLEERIEAQGPTTWLDWIKAECPLVDGDIEFVEVVLAGLAPRAQEQAARRYVAAWQAAADAEPLPHRKANAGRRAANQTLLPARERPMATSTTRQPRATTPPPRLPEGVRMAWTIRVDGRRLTLAGAPYTREQAQRAAEARWPRADVEVLADA